MHRPRLVIMVKEPRAGRVKSRLGREIGMVRAAWWFRHQLARLTREVVDPRWETLLAVAPDAALASPMLPPLTRLPQGPGDLGDRMARVFAMLPPGPAIIIGADIPGITRARIAEGFKLLGRHDAVFGPASDGGYWAVGLKRSRPLPTSLFKGVRWSTEHALADTLATLPGYSTGFIDQLSDIDTAADLAAVSR